MKLPSQQKLYFFTVALALAWALSRSPSFAEARVEHGSASWYSVKTNGGTHTASGQTLKDGAATAAHKTLPLGTKVRVTNLANGKSQVVTITDRGPYIAGRVIDVTVGTAERLGFVQRGVVPVKVETVGQSTGGEREVDRERKVVQDQEVGRDREVVQDREVGRGREVGRDREVDRGREVDRDRKVGRERKVGRDHGRDRDRDADRSSRLRRGDRSSERDEGGRQGTAWGLFTGPRRCF